MDNFIENDNLQTIMLVYKSKKDQNTEGIKKKKIAEVLISKSHLALTFSKGHFVIALKVT